MLTPFGSALSDNKFPMLYEYDMEFGKNSSSTVSPNQRINIKIDSRQPTSPTMNVHFYLTYLECNRHR